MGVSHWVCCNQASIRITFGIDDTGSNQALRGIESDARIRQFFHRDQSYVHVPCQRTFININMTLSLILTHRHTH